MAWFKRMTMCLLVLSVAAFGYNEILRSNQRAEEAAAHRAYMAKPLCVGKESDLKALETGGACRPF